MKRNILKVNIKNIVSKDLKIKDYMEKNQPPNTPNPL